jgi:hypothetical protein
VTEFDQRQALSQIGADESVRYTYIFDTDPSDEKARPSSMMPTNLLDAFSAQLQPANVDRLTKALEVYVNAKSKKEDALLDVLLPAFQESGIDRHLAFEVADAAEVQRKANRKAELEKRAVEKGAKKAAKSHPSNKTAVPQPSLESGTYVIGDQIQVSAVHCEHSLT